MYVETTDSDFARIAMRNFLLFLAGAILGCLLVRLWGLSAGFSSSFFQNTMFSGYTSVALGSFRFLMLLFLLAFMSVGALLIPVLFGLEGAIIGGTIALSAGAMGFHGGIALILTMLPRLILIIPFGFLLGAWAVRQSLSFGQPRRSSSLGIFAALMVVVLVSAFLQVTLGYHLGGTYYLSFGV